MPSLNKTETQKTIYKAICECYPIDDATRRLINQANYDLYFGPGSDGDDYPGFQDATAQIKKALDDVGELWVDTDSGCWSKKEPDSGYEDENGEWQEYYMDGWYHLERNYVLREIVGKELVSYIN